MVTARARVKFGPRPRAEGSHVRQGDFTEDAILGGRLRIRQPARGYRVNVDTILLAAAVEPGSRLLEAGCGVGAAALAVAVRTPGAHVVGVERDGEMAAFARENVAANAMGDRITIIEGDALDRAANWGVFDGVFVNPPFDMEGDGRAPAQVRRDSHIAEQPVNAWIVALADRLKGGAALTMIHRAAKLAEILAALEGRLGGVEILPVRPRLADPAKRVLVRARKGSRAPLVLLRGLDLHDSSGAKYTPEVDEILHGTAEIAWS